MHGNDVTLPILEGQAAVDVAVVLATRTQTKTTDQQRLDFERELATNARLPDWNPETLSFWTLGLFAGRRRPRSTTF
jgi:hypothetical protein